MNSDAGAQFIERTSCIKCGSTDLNVLSSGLFDEGVVGRFINEDPWGEHPAPFLVGKRWVYVSCRSCDMAFHKYILAPDWNERRFSKWMSQSAIEAFEKPLKNSMSNFHKASNYTAHVLRIEKLTRSVRQLSAPRVLDFGCGYGGFLAMCSQYGFDAVGVDRSSAKRDNGSYLRVYAEIETVEKLGPFHAITLFEVLEHLDDPKSLMSQLRNLIVDRGILILETPDCTGVVDIQTRADYGKIHPLEHINGFTPKTLDSFAANLGFIKIEKPACYVTSDFKQAGKIVTKTFLSSILKSTTQRYYRKI